MSNTSNCADARNGVRAHGPHKWTDEDNHTWTCFGYAWVMPTDQQRIAARTKYVQQAMREGRSPEDATWTVRTRVEGRTRAVSDTGRDHPTRR
jgi:predicted secreted protein